MRDSETESECISSACRRKHLCLCIVFFSVLYVTNISKKPSFYNHKITEFRFFDMSVVFESFVKNDS